MTPKSRALLFRAGGLGDLIVALPAVSLARRMLPEFRLTLVGRPEYSALLLRAGIVDEILAFDDPRLTGLFAPEGEEGPASALAGSEPAIGWLNRRGDWPADEWWASREKEKTLFVAYEPASQLPISRFFFDRTLEHFKLTRGAADRLFGDCARLTLGREVVLEALASLDLNELGTNERRLVVHPGSGSRAKRWPLRNFAEIIRQAASRAIGGVLVTGEAEADIEAEVRDLRLPAGWGRASCLTAETLAGLLASSTHYIGNDSGPTHLAAACGASVLAVFRDENLPAWRPFGRTRVLSAPAVERITVELGRDVLDDFFATDNW